jgi:CubicO group peptidase (beta-lactamase class C family)
MTDMTFSPTEEQRARLLPIKSRTPDGGLVDVPIELPPEPEWAAAGHGSYGTLADYGRFIRAMLRDGELDGERVLRPETVQLAFSDHIEGIPMPEVMKSADKTLANDVPSLPFEQGWGLGFHLFKEDIPGMRSAGSGDWAGIFNTYYWIDRAGGVGGLLMTQVLPFFDESIVQTLLAFETATYNEVGAALPAA